MEGGEGIAITRDGAQGIGSKRVAAEQNSPPTAAASLGGENNNEKQDKSQIQHDHDAQTQPGWKRFLAHIGPGILVAVAYMDPGNFEVDLQIGANHKYQLLWVLFLGMIFALIIQSLAASLGVKTGKHLAEVCKAEYPKFVSYILWFLAEAAVILADIPEVIATAFALNILFSIPVWAGVLITGLSAVIVLGVQRYGIRKLEAIIAMLVLIIAGCFFAELSYVKPKVSEVVKGLFVPNVKGNGAIGDALAFVGATVMPHNLFLHSALVLSRKALPSVKGIKEACRFFFWESALALLLALLLNITIVIVSGTVCFAPDLSPEAADTCGNLTLRSASFLLKHVLGKSSSTVYAISLLASGQTSTITCTYAGQYIMQGFLNFKLKQWKRNLITRTAAIIPSVIVSVIGGSSAAGSLIIISSIILSFELPFALIPLLKFTSSRKKMGPHKTSLFIIVISWILGVGLTGINIYFIFSSYIGWLIHSRLPKVATVFISIIVFPLMVVYILAILYLTFKKDTAVTYIETSDSLQIEVEKGRHSTDAHSENEIVPYREDLADIPFPE